MIMSDYKPGSLASSAIGAMVVTLVLCLVAAYFVGWDQWWVYFVIAISWLGFVINIIKFLVIYGKKCPQCQSNISSKSKFCKNCGFQFYKKCPKCDKLLRTGARYCDNCGEALPQQV